MGKRESAPEVNAGSMADIAFLLLIFFLVTTTIEIDVGLNRKLPGLDGKPIEHHQRNVFSVLIDNQGKLMVNQELIEPESLKELAIQFIDNGGGTTEERSCGYCKGEGSAESSDNPTSAIIVLGTQRETSYGAYIAVQNEIVAAYNALRNREANRLYKMDYTLMDSQYRNSQTSQEQKVVLMERMKTIRKMFPLNLSEAELKTTRYDKIQ